MKVRLKGAWEDWIKFFLKGISETSEEAAKTAREVIQLKEELITRLYKNSLSSVYGVKLVDLLFETPLMSVKEVSEKLNISKEAANELVKKFEKIGILKEITGKQRYKKYSFREYIDIIARGTKNAAKSWSQNSFEITSN
jgi:Fic family protein